MSVFECDCDGRIWNGVEILVVCVILCVEWVEWFLFFWGVDCVRKISFVFDKYFGLWMWICGKKNFY